MVTLLWQLREAPSTSCAPSQLHPRPLPHWPHPSYSPTRLLHKNNSWSLNKKLTLDIKMVAVVFDSLADLERILAMHSFIK